MNTKLLSVVLVGAVFSLVLDSCKKDNPQPVDPIAGTWARDSYDLTVPAAFVKHTGGIWYSFGESGYTIVFGNDKTYQRSFTGWSVQNVVGDLNDGGTWVKDATTLTLKPSNADDEDKILNINYWPVGDVFTIDSDITTSRMNLSRSVKLTLLSDPLIDSLNKNPKYPIKSSDYQSVDVKIAYKFRKVK
jgi:hypothetical protein